ncbi:MAG: BadF/BadG/BcrA/BcrD ATPase family protein [Gemmatimonadales bacterium]
MGVDAGGSHTAAAISRADFAILGRAEGPGAPLRPGGAAATAAAVAEVSNRAARVADIPLPVERAVVGAAGAGRAQERHDLRVALAAHGLARLVEVVADGEIALAAVFGTEPGILVNAGTGSIAYARDRQGRLRRSGGYGWQLGDAGGGYWIGRRALAEAAKARDRMGEGTLLARVLAALGLREFDELVRWAATASPSQVASLAPRVFSAAADGDPAAQRITAEAAQELVELALVVEPMFSPDDPVLLATGGGLLTPASPLYVAFSERLVSALPRVRLVEIRPDPPIGALRLAANFGV